MTAPKVPEGAGADAPAPSAREIAKDTPPAGAPAPSAKRRKTPTVAASPAPSGTPAQSVPERGCEKDVPTPWPFPYWNGQKVPRPKVARKVSHENWEESPF